MYEELEIHTNNCLDLTAEREVSPKIFKESMFESLCKELQHGVFLDQPEKVTLKVRLRNCYLDTLKKAKFFFPVSILKPIQVEFVGEVAIDDGGPMNS